jgi:phasin
MFDKPQFEIPDAVREMAERNVEQVRSAYAKFMDIAKQAQDTAAKSQGAMAQSALEIQSRVMRFTQQNVESNFAFASDLARARDIKEYLEIQSRYAQNQVQTYTQQAQELGRLVAEAAQRAQPKA